MTRTLRLPVGTRLVASAFLLLPCLAPAADAPVTRDVALPGGTALALVQVPAGEFLMGAPMGESSLDQDEQPQEQVTLAKPFWLGKCEITNAQFRLFRPDHNSREMDTNWKDRVGPGPSLDGDTQPVVRISWLDAMAFCEWLSKQTGLRFRLPTEAEWEYACRAGTDTQFSCPDAQLQKYANFADANLGSIKPWALRDNSRNDGAVITCPVGSYQPNPWGLQDMHGNAAEWCATLYREYPYSATDGREDQPRTAGFQPAGAVADVVVRGGSFDDRPRRCRSAFRQHYPKEQGVYNVGFRVVCEGE